MRVAILTLIAMGALTMSLWAPEWWMLWCACGLGTGVLAWPMEHGGR
jgi:hypothetical protein